MKNNVKIKRQKLKISQEKLARLVDCTISTIQNIENKNSDTSVYIAIKLKRALQCENVEELFIVDEND